MISEQVILVNEEDKELGVMDKLTAHERALLHRAFSVFIFNKKGEMLLQQRAKGKYHSGGLWSNACCSHPRPGESTPDAARRRLQEEVGIDTRLEKIFDFVYKAGLDKGLTENEFDHVFAGEYDGPSVYNTEEVQDLRFMDMKALSESIISEPGKYTVWFQLAFPRVKDWWESRYKQAVL